MQIDLETIRWFLSGAFFLMLGGMGYIWKREISQLREALAKGDSQLGDEITDAEAAIKAQDKRIDESLQQINGIKQDFVSKAELKEQLKIQLDPIKDDMRDIKADVKQLLQRP